MNIGKKLLSLLTVFCLTLSLVPTVALAATPNPTNVTVNGTNVVPTDTTNPTYYKNNSLSSSALINGVASDYNVAYDSTSNILTLKGYSGGPICANGDLTIYLDGTNKIRSGDNGINLGYGSFSASNASLTIEGSGSLEVTSAQNSTVYTTGNITIQGGAKVTVNGGNSGQAIHAVGGTLTITGNGTEVKATGGIDNEKSCSIKSGDSGNGMINVNDAAKLTASAIEGALKINGTDATDAQKNNLSNGVTADRQYSISGTVNGIDGSAIEGATVQLAPTGTDNASTLSVINPSITDRNGRYSFSGLSAGTYKLTVSKEHYTTVEKNNINVSGTTTEISIDDIEISPIYQVKIAIPDSAHMTKTSDSGELTQDITKNGAIKPVVFTADQGYYFPRDYSVTEVNGIKVTQSSPTEINVSGIPTADTTITLMPPSAKENQDAPSGLVVNDCTSSTSKDGSISMVTNTMEYKKNTDSTWITVSSWNIPNLEPGTYLIRYKETGTKQASPSAEVTVSVLSEYNLWVCGIPVTRNNKDNILGNESAIYNSNNNTLTLNNAKINNIAVNAALSSGSSKRNSESAGIMAKDTLIINVSGNSSISSEYGNAIKGENLTINSSNASKLTLDSYANMSAIEVNTAKEKLRSLTITGNVEIVATITPKSEGNPPNQSGGTAISAYDIVIQDEAKVTAISRGQGFAVFGTGELTVKDFATLTAQSKYKDYAIYTYGGFIYPGHSITASTSFEGNDPETTYDPEKLTTKYKYVKVEPITVTGVELNKDSLSIKVGQSETLTATLQPSDAVQNVTWTSSDDKIVTVTNGTVTAVGLGTATITVTTTNGGKTYTDTCTVTVTNASSSSGSHTTYYPVNTPAKSEGGSVVVSPKSASKGSAVTVTVTPESGYQVSSVQAVDKDGKKLTLTDKGDGKYTFVMPASKVEVSASFAQVQKPEEASPYRDVSKDSYYYDAVQWASDKGITNGVSDGVFAPDWVCTRGQIVTFLWRSVGSPAPKTAEMPFADVAEDAYYAQAVLWAVENGITKGTSETTFSPDQTCTRAHAVAFLYRLAGSPAVTGSSFQDVAADAYYNAAVAWAVQQGITNGTSETTFSPDETCTRAQIVTFLYRMDQAK